MTGRHPPEKFYPPSRSPGGQKPSRAAAESRRRQVNLPQVPLPRREQRPMPPINPAAPALHGDALVEPDPWENDELQGFTPGFNDGPNERPASPGAAAQSPAPAAYPTISHQPSSAPADPDFESELKPPRPRLRFPAGVSQRVHRLSRNWAVWSVLSLVGVGSLGVISALSLFRIPNLPNCRAIFWPTASAATRLQCADAYAEEGSVNSLLAAIELVNALPQDHPLRAEIDQKTEAWGDRILDIADETFQQGGLDEAIDIARRIPETTAAASLVDERIEQWLEIWANAESIYQTVETLLRQQKFREAFSTATQLLAVGNTHWETTKYQEITQAISTARADLSKLAKARSLIRKGDTDSILEAMELIRSISSESYLYSEAQSVLQETADGMLDLAQSALDRRDAAQALKILNQIPSSAGLQGQAADFRIIVEAHQRAWQGTVTDLESAIVRVQSIGPNRPLYRRAQGLISQWRLQTQGLVQLSEARQIAALGTTSDLQAAIVAAESIPRSNPAWDQAQAQINQWRSRVQTIEDQPFLDRANVLATGGDVASLRAAIAEAERIRPNRALHDEAQTNIRRWRAQVQRSEDQPILAQARQLASGGNYQQAIATASQISANRALYSEAQADIANWRGQIEGAQQLQDAYTRAEANTPDGLTRAIAIAQGILSSSPVAGDARAAVNRWSWELLALAEAQAGSNLPQAVTLVQQVPAQSEAYAAAQQRLQEWQQRQGTIPAAATEPVLDQ